MKTSSVTFCWVALFIVTSANSQIPLAESPGKLEMAKHPLILEPPVGPQTQKLDPVKLRQESNELAQLAQSVPADVDQAMQGKLPKDLAEKLKHIEKLSKRLRQELSP